MSRSPRDDNPDPENQRDSARSDVSPSPEQRADTERRRLQRRMFDRPKTEPSSDMSRSLGDLFSHDNSLLTRPVRPPRERNLASAGDMNRVSASADHAARDEQPAAGAILDLPANPPDVQSAIPSEASLAPAPLVAAAEISVEKTEIFDAASPSLSMSLPAADFNLNDLAASASKPTDVSAATTDLERVENEEPRSTAVDPTSDAALPDWLRTSREPLRSTPSDLSEKLRRNAPAERPRPLSPAEAEIRALAAFDPREKEPVSFDLRATRSSDEDMPRVDDHSRGKRPTIDRDMFNDRIEPRFDSASDEAVTSIDSSIPPLRERSPAGVTRRAGLERGNPAALDLLADADGRMSTGGVRNARAAFEQIHGQVDEMRVARAEARFKPTVPTMEDLIAQSRSDEMEEFQIYLDDPYADVEMPPPPAPQRRAGLAQRLNIFRRGSEHSAATRMMPQAQRAQRRKRQSRLYEDIVAWIIVPPFLIGVIYAVITISRLFAGSPLSKLLSGQ